MKPMSNTDNSKEKKVTKIAFTTGEPAGVGPDLALSLITRPREETIVFFADPEVISARALAIGQQVKIIELRDTSQAIKVPPGYMQLVASTCPNPNCVGTPNPENSPYVLKCLDKAVDSCASGKLDAMVTGPINKEIINNAGIPFTGHTEYIAERLNAPLPVMMLTSDTLRVVLLTTHIPLSKVPDHINRRKIVDVVEIVHRELITKFGIQNPRIQICGLNPHAGEGGHLGQEEESIIKPALKELSAMDIIANGPVSADSAFTSEARKEYDAIVAMYHDQGLVALKTIGFGSSVNLTLGLPIIRSSVDHGTALDIAGSGNVDSGSAEAALELAINISKIS
jgi:4-hydroxythreonine-4-phosphate dehydrogenase